MGQFVIFSSFSFYMHVYTLHQAAETAAAQQKQESSGGGGGGGERGLAFFFDLSSSYGTTVLMSLQMSRQRQLCLLY
jgi:hypothetical protein